MTSKLPSEHRNLHLITLKCKQLNWAKNSSEIVLCGMRPLKGLVIHGEEKGSHTMGIKVPSKLQY